MRIGPVFQGVVLPLLTLLAAANVACAQSDLSLPHIVKLNGRYALFVDNAPYIILGAQVHNSSAWPAMLPKVWPAMETLHANTVEIPIYWEQFEPQEGNFDYSVIDTIIDQARQHNLHVVFLWFGTWKNGSNHYLPQWMKLQPQRYPNMIGPDGKYVDSPSPFATETLAADTKAFVALMAHLKQYDTPHTVLMVQVENESGSWQCDRDYSPDAQKAFDSPVPREALAAMGIADKGATPTWKEAFGDNANEYFHSWFIARYISQVAAAGKAVYPLPLYVNVAVRDPIANPKRYEFGGPTDNVIPLWKAAAPAIDVLAPDIYERDTRVYLKLLELYNRPDNPLFVPETIGQGPLSRFMFAVIGRGAIGYSPFGLDYTRSVQVATPSAQSPEEALAATSLNYELIAPMDRDVARLSLAGKIQTAVEGESKAAEHGPATTLHFGNWDVDVFFGTFIRDHAAPRPSSLENSGRVLIAQLGDNQLLGTGLYTRLTFHPTGPNADRPWQYLAVEEGKYENGVFQPQRILNGDETDWGVFFVSSPTVLRISLYTR